VFLQPLTFTVREATALVQCVRGTREITRWILGYGGDVEVLGPESLRDAVAEAGRRMAAIYSPK
jgi:predicted DNA-binding transcriptional regulator YafY